jgi:hypothetical protein
VQFVVDRLLSAGLSKHLFYLATDPVACVENQRGPLLHENEQEHHEARRTKLTAKGTWHPMFAKPARRSSQTTDGDDVQENELVTPLHHRSGYFAVLGIERKQERAGGCLWLFVARRMNTLRRSDHVISHRTDIITPYGLRRKRGSCYIRGFMSFLDRVRECNSYDLANFLPFVVDSITVGHVRKSLVDRLGRFRNIFVVRSDCVAMASDLRNPADRTAAMVVVVNALVDEGVVKGVRNESYPVATAFGDDPMLQIERAAVPLFGVRAFGIHLNGYVRSGNDTLMWVARRSMNKPTYPGKLDQLVAGGQPVGISLSDNLVKECREEAFMPEALARQAVSFAPISYCFESDRGLHPNVLFCYDLELPIDFQPHNTDLEVEQFHLWPIERVMDIVATTDDFKANCSLVAIDFFIRHGFLTSRHPDYLELMDLLYRPHLFTPYTGPSMILRPN